MSRSWVSLGIVLAAVTIATIERPGLHASPPIRSDGLGYHAWTRALLERDLSFCKYAELRVVQAFASEDPARGVCQNRYPPGLALLRFPVMAFLVDQHRGAPLVSSAEHQACLIIGGAVLIMICACALGTLRMLDAGSLPSQVAVLSFVFGTGLFHYATFDASFTHVYSALGVALLVWLGVRGARRDPSGPIPGLPLALVAFFLIAIRQTNVILLILLSAAYAGYRLHRATGIATGPLVHRARSAVQCLVPALFGAGAALAVEATYNWYATGSFVTTSYGDQHFTFDRPAQFQVLASYQRGLFTYYPVVAVALAAGLAVRRTRVATLGFAGLVAAYVMLYGFWWSWYLGGGFGHRGFVELMPVGMVVFGMALHSMGRRARTGVGFAAAIVTIVTLSLMAGYWNGTLPLADTTRELYWAHVCGDRSLVAAVVASWPRIAPRP